MTDEDIMAELGPVYGWDRQARLDLGLLRVARYAVANAIHLGLVPAPILRCAVPGCTEAVTAIFTPNIFEYAHYCTAHNPMEQLKAKVAQDRDPGDEHTSRVRIPRLDAVEERLAALESSVEGNASLQDNLFKRVIALEMGTTLDKQMKAGF